MGHVEDRWKDKDKQRTGRWGKGRRYRARYLDPSGKERSRSFDLKPDADRFIIRVSAEVMDGKYFDPALGRQTLRAFAERWYDSYVFRSQGNKDEVRRRLDNHILYHLGNKQMAQIAQSPMTIKSWLAKERASGGSSGKPVGTTFAANLLGQLSAIMKAAEEEGIVFRNPCKLDSVKIKPDERPPLVPWERAEVDAIQVAMPDWIRAICDVGAGLGLRQGEAFGLSPDDIEFLRNVVHVRRQVILHRGRPCFAPPKFGRTRDIPLPESVKQRLSAHLARFPARPVALAWESREGERRTVPLMFTSAQGKALRRGTFDQYQWVPALRTAKITPGRDHGFHQLRHHFASAALHDGVDIKALAEYLGHRDPAFTLRTYTHVMPRAADRLRQAIDKDMNFQDHGPDTASAARD